MFYLDVDSPVDLLGEFAFPDGDDGPGEGVEALGAQFVAGDVAGYLFFPESGVRLGFDVLGATSVAVPEAAVDEDDGAVLEQDEVARSGTAAPGRFIRPGRASAASISMLISLAPLHDNVSSCRPGVSALLFVRGKGT